MRITFLSLLYPLSFFISTFSYSQENLPLYVPEERVMPMKNMVDENLQQRLNKIVQANPTWNSLVKQKRLAIGIVDLKDPFRPRFARLNGNEMMYAASLPKIAILLASMDALDKGELNESDEVVSDMNRMICYSDNQASTRMIDRLGYEKIEGVLTDPSYKLYDKSKSGGLWVGKRYAAAGPRHPDPIKGLSHAATVSQVCRFYYLLALGKLVNRDRSRQMLEIMDDPALHHKFVNTLDRVAPNAHVYRKSGSWKSYHADSALVWDENPMRRYILVALAQDEQGEQIIRQMVNVAEQTLSIKNYSSRSASVLGK
ncbi:MAG: serine hydrolase [Saprospiraceae bacterium]|nr:serine hydrolase [Saprospiraceae bacterium]